MTKKDLANILNKKLGISLKDTLQAIDKLRELNFELFNISQRTYEFSFRKK